LSERVIGAIERHVLPAAAFATAGSQPIAEAYADKYGVRPITINNVFPLPTEEPHRDRAPGPRLRLYWFSQVVGPGRGLEDAIEAAGLLDRPVWLGLLGWNGGDYPVTLRDWAARSFPKLSLELLGNRPAEEMVDVARHADVGLALETGQPLNRDLCCTNKIFTYVLAGLAVAGTATRGQRPVLEDLGEGGWLYPPGDGAALARGLKRWADDPHTLQRAKQAAWAAAKRRWHWEHPLERGALLDAVARVFARR
jgi:glycosyltransferase involved in cell wall biosynthesis